MKTKELNIDVGELYPQLTRVETTIGSNGYPKGLQFAYHCESRKEMAEIVEELTNSGHDVTELMLRKRNGQQLWNRDLQNHFSVDFETANDFDSCINLDMDNGEFHIKYDIEAVLIGDDEDHREELGQEKIDKIVDDFYEDVKYHIGRIKVFYRPDYDNDVDYVITEDCTGYYDGDVTTYQMAFSVELPEEE